MECPILNFGVCIGVGGFVFGGKRISLWEGGKGKDFHRGGETSA